MMNGIERIRFTKAADGYERILQEDRRAIASSVPKKMPPASAMPKSCSDSFMPSHSTSRLFQMTAQSKSMASVPRGLGDVARHRDAALEPAHEEDHREGDDDVDQRRGGERLERLERVLGDLPALRGELEDADGERRGRVLEDGEELARH